MILSINKLMLIVSRVDLKSYRGGMVCVNHDPAGKTPIPVLAPVFAEVQNQSESSSAGFAGRAGVYYKLSGQLW
jgi:hypothetical protein